MDDGDNDDNEREVDSLSGLLGHSQSSMDGRGDETKKQKMNRMKWRMNDAIFFLITGYDCYCYDCCCCC